MKKILTTCANATTGSRGFLERNNRFIAVASIICFAVGLALSHRIEPGVHVQKVMLADDTPALKFLPAGPGPHPVALLAHGYAGSKETLFRYGEALSAAGFICYDVDLPGHGSSLRTYTFMDAVHTLEAVAREVGPVDVFAGHSLGGFTGGEAVREGGMRPGLFIAIGSIPVLGDHARALLFLDGRFEETGLSMQKARTDARLVISPWSDHLLEAFDPVLVNAAVDAACAAVHKTPPPPPTAWRWRLIGAVLAMLAAGTLASCLTDLFPQLARFRGLLVGVFVVVAFMITLGGRWLDATPHLQLQGIAMPVTFLLAMIAGRLRIPRWSFAALDVLVMVIALCWLNTSESWAAVVIAISTLLLAPALIVGIIIGWVAGRRGSRLQGDIAMAIIVGCVPFQCLEPPRTAPEAPKSHIAIKLDAKLFDAFVGQYEFPPDNRVDPGSGGFLLGMKLTIWRQGDQLRGQFADKNKSYVAFDIYPESETNFFETNSPRQYTFVKNDEGVMAVIFHPGQGLPDHEGKKLKNE
jgi:pimeloyl-ACP methyl ester carboxylesterase